MRNWNKKRLARLAATPVAVGVAITLVSPGTASAAAAPNTDPPSGAVTHQPDRPDVPDAHTMNPRPPAPSAPSDPGPSNSAPSNSGVGQAPSAAPPAAPKPQRKDQPPDRDPHKFSPAKRTPAGQQSKRDNDNNRTDNRETTDAPTPPWATPPAPAPAAALAPTPTPAPGTGQGFTPQAGAAELLGGMSNVLVSADRTVKKVLTDANNAVNQVLGRLPTPQRQRLEPGLTVVKAPKKSKPNSTSAKRETDVDTQEYRPVEEGTGTQFEDYDLFERPPHIIGMPERDLTEEVPGYEVQEQRSDAYSDGWVYYCGPASAQNTLAIIGIDISQDELRERLGTTDNGTDTIDQVAVGLNGVLEDNGETPVYATASVSGGAEIHPVTGKSAATEDEIKQVREDVRWSISKGYPVIVNVTETAPGVTINGEPHGYPGHYVTVVGYDKEADTVKIADSAYAPRVDADGNQVGWESGTYEMKTEDLAHWSTGKGYSYAEGYPAPGT